VASVKPTQDRSEIGLRDHDLHEVLVRLWRFIHAAEHVTLRSTR